MNWLQDMVRIMIWDYIPYAKYDRIIFPELNDPKVQIVVSFTFSCWLFPFRQLNPKPQLGIIIDSSYAFWWPFSQVSLRWIYEQGAGVVVKSFSKERMKENIDIFDWDISKEELHEISQIPQYKGLQAEEFVSANGPFKSVDELWDGEI